MAWANPQTDRENPRIISFTLILVYMVLEFGSAVFVFIRALLVATFGLKTSENLFANMLRSIFCAPMSFFDSTPIGCILNCVSIDQSVVDLDIPFRVGGFASTTIQLFGIIVVMSKVTWKVLVLFVPMSMACLWMQKYYMASSRELVRMIGISKAPIIYHFGKSIARAATIRIFGQEQRFMERNLYLYDCYACPFIVLQPLNGFSYRWNCYKLVSLLSQWLSL